MDKNNINYNDFWYTYECGEDYEEQFDNLRDAKKYCRKNGIDKIYKVKHFADKDGEYSGYNELVKTISVDDYDTQMYRHLASFMSDCDSLAYEAKSTTIPHKDSDFDNPSVEYLVVYWDGTDSKYGKTEYFSDFNSAKRFAKKMRDNGAEAMIRKDSVWGRTDDMEYSSSEPLKYDVDADAYFSGSKRIESKSTKEGWDYDNFSGSGYRDYQLHDMANEPYEDNYVDYAVYDDFGMISNGFDTEEEAIRYAKANGGTEVCEVTHWEDSAIDETIVWEDSIRESRKSKPSVKRNKLSENSQVFCDDFGYEIPKYSNANYEFRLWFDNTIVDNGIVAYGYDDAVDIVKGNRLTDFEDQNRDIVAWWLDRGNNPNPKTRLELVDVSFN